MKLKTVWVILDEKGEEIARQIGVENNAWETAVCEAPDAWFHHLFSHAEFMEHAISVMKLHGWRAVEMRLMPKEPLVEQRFYVVLDDDGIAYYYSRSENELIKKYKEDGYAVKRAALWEVE